jgi:hypothetical protein
MADDHDGDVLGRGFAEVETTAARRFLAKGETILASAASVRLWQPLLGLPVCCQFVFLSCCHILVLFSFAACLWSRLALHCLLRLMDRCIN